MKRLIIIFSFLLFVVKEFSQIDTSKTLPVLYNPEFYPTYSSGEIELMKFIDSNLKHPKQCVYGIVYVEFIVEKDGSLTNFKVKHSPHDLLSKEALRVCKLIPQKWEPGGYYSSKGKQFRQCRMILPVRFQTK